MFMMMMIRYCCCQPQFEGVGQNDDLKINFGIG